ncbi:unnamed protein product, partial [Pelagomonas calceolata]
MWGPIYAPARVWPRVPSCRVVPRVGIAYCPPVRRSPNRRAGQGHSCTSRRAPTPRRPRRHVRRGRTGTASRSRGGRRRGPDTRSTGGGPCGRARPRGRNSRGGETFRGRLIPPGRCGPRPTRSREQNLRLLRHTWKGDNRSSRTIRCRRGQGTRARSRWTATSRCRRRREPGRRGRLHRGERRRGAWRRAVGPPPPRKPGSAAAASRRAAGPASRPGPTPRTLPPPPRRVDARVSPRTCGCTHQDKCTLRSRSPARSAVELEASRTQHQGFRGSRRDAPRSGRQPHHRLIRSRHEDRGRRRRHHLLGRRASSRGRASPPAAPTSRISRGGMQGPFCNQNTLRNLLQTPPRRATRGSSRGAGTGRRLSRPPYRSLPRAGQRKLRWLGTRGQP